MRELINEIARATASMAYIDGMGGEVNYFRAIESLLFNYKKLAALVAAAVKAMDEWKEAS